MLVGWFSLSMAVAVTQEGSLSVSGAAGAPDFYLIQNGDTLWDISTRFLGDPSLGSKMRNERDRRCEKLTCSAFTTSMITPP